MLPVTDQTPEKLSGLPSLATALTGVSVGHSGGGSVWEELCGGKRVLYTKGVISCIVGEATQNTHLPCAQGPGLFYLEKDVNESFLPLESKDLWVRLGPDVPVLSCMAHRFLITGRRAMTGR